VSFPEWLARRLVVRDARGNRPPGAGLARRWVEPDGDEIVVIAQGDGFDLVLKHPKNITIHGISVKTALALARFLVRWWVWSSWCGAKMRLWGWTQGRLVEQAARRNGPPELARPR